MADDLSEQLKLPQRSLEALRRYTPARIALRRIGASLGTEEVLGFSLAHARARDAVHTPLDLEGLRHSLDLHGLPSLTVRSRARDRAEYLRRPDLGRQLDAACRAILLSSEPAPANRLTLVLADGLSSFALACHALPMVLALRTELRNSWTLDTLILATNARVALADEVGALRAAEAVVILLGERPGLGARDSLGLYMTYQPRLGRTDAERNCISNVRADGLSYAEAAYRLRFLLDQARQAGESGIRIKDATDAFLTPSLPGESDVG